MFEGLRWQLPAGERGLNNSFTALYARKLIEDPQWASAFEVRRRSPLTSTPRRNSPSPPHCLEPLLSSRPVVLVVAAADMEAQSYRGTCLERVAAHYDVVLISGAEPTWEKEFLLDYEVADPADEAALSGAGRALAERHVLAGVMTWTEWYLVPVARLARRLGLPTTAAEVLQGCRNKHTSRTLFARHGCPPPPP